MVLIIFSTGKLTNTTMIYENIDMVKMGSVENQSQIEEPLYSNPEYLHHNHPTYPPSSPGYDEIEDHSNKPTHYQPLHTGTRDYISMYSTTTAAGRKGAPSVEVEGKLYSIVDPTRREEHVYSTTQQ